MKNGFPGFCDLQVNGCLGVDFSSPSLSESECLRAFREILSHGTAVFLPTIITAAREVYKRNIPLILHCAASDEFKLKIPGLHLEGPFISKEPGASGAHNPTWMSEPDINYLDELISLAEGKIKILTVAAELKGIEELIAHASKAEITVSCGHQMAMSSELERAAQAGARSITHLGNGLPGVLPRHPNQIWDALACDSLKGMIITDGHHLPASVIKTAIRTKGIDNIIVVSDASPLAGFPPGRYHAFGSEAVIDKNGRLYNPVAGNLAGSSSFMLECMNYLASLKLLSEDELMKAGLYNPLALIGIAPAILDDLPSKITYRNGSFELFSRP